MDQLRKNVMHEISEVYKEVVECIKEGIEGDGIDLTELLGSKAVHHENVNQYITDFKERNKKNKRWF